MYINSEERSATFNNATEKGVITSKNILLPLNTVLLWSQSGKGLDMNVGKRNGLHTMQPYIIN